MSQQRKKLVAKAAALWATGIFVLWLIPIEGQAIGVVAGALWTQIPISWVQLRW